jgi:two-component system, sensor histidine kinase
MQQAAIHREQANLLFNNLPFVLIGGVASATGLAVVLWNVAPQPAVLWWLGAVYALSAVRWFSAIKFKRSAPPVNGKGWMSMALQCTALSGVLWGLGSLLFFSTDPLVVMTLATFLAAMVAGAVSSHACYNLSYIAFAMPAAAPFAARCLWEQQLSFVVLGILTIIFVLVNVRYGRNLEKMVLKTIRLQFQNNELVTELTSQKNVAEQASLAKTRFLAAASHDLRQPVQAIELLVDALSEDLSNHPSRHLLDRIQDAGHGLRNLLNSLLDSSKIDAAAITVTPRNVNLMDMLQRLCKEFAAQANEKNLDLRLVKTTRWAYTDPALLELIVRNLIENAIKYTRTGRVLVGCRRHNGGFRLEVHDTGTGIASELQPFVFEEFYQASNHSDSERPKGLGLGLYIVRSLAALMQHQIGLQSTEGKGSMFYIHLPPGQPEYKTATGVTAQRTPHNPLKGKVVLLIDDDVLVRNSVTEMLERWQCTTVCAESAESAISLLLSRGLIPNAIIADYRLRQRVTGVQAIHALHLQLGKIPALILTGDTAPSRIQEAKESGFRVLHKPLSGAQLRGALGEVIT